MTALNFTCGFCTDAKFVDYWGWTLRDFAIFTFQPDINWQNGSNITAKQKKNPGKNREFFHDFSSFCKNMSRQLSLWSLFFAFFSAMLCDLHDLKTIENYFWLELWGFVQAFVFFKDGNYA